MKLLLMADGEVGGQITRWLIDECSSDLAALVVTSEESEAASLARQKGIPALVFRSAAEVVEHLDTEKIEPDLGVLAWWPTIIKPPLIGKPKHGFVNTHPSFLPYNRGKHYNFWALVEQVPFGVTLHMVTEGVDSGDIVAQKRIEYSWEDNGQSLYEKAKSAMIDLFRETYPLLRTLQFPHTPQDSTLGSFHRASELEPASRIEIDGQYRARDLFNLLRARTFPGHPACLFEDAGETFEVRITIQRKK